MAPAEKTNRRPFRRKRRRSRQPKDALDQAPSTRNKVSKKTKAGGELPEVFIYTYTIYKALD